MKPLWAIQKLALNDHDGREMTVAIKELGLDYVELDIAPFDYANITPPAYNGPVIPYGGTNFIEAIIGKEGWFCVFNDNFRYSIAIQKLGNVMFNHDGKFMKLKDFDPAEFKDSEFIFARPNKDTKEFAGMTVKPLELFDWVMSSRGMTYIEDIDILVAPASRIDREWRLYVVEGKVVGGSQYRYNHTLCRSPNVPSEVSDYVTRAIGIWQPAPFFVMDVCEVSGSLSVLEIGDLHSAGWYASDKKAIIGAISKYVDKET